MDNLEDSRRRIFEVIELGAPGDHASLVYDRFMMAMILASLLPLFFKQTYAFLAVVDRITSAVFLVDYALRWWTADFKVKRGMASFLIYPFTFLALLDLASIVPFFITTSVRLQLFRLVRLTRALRGLRMLRYSKSFYLIMDVVQRERRSLVAVVWMAGGYVILSSLVMFQVEPENFATFFDAFYWAVVTMTTVGYGDIYPVSELGRIVSMISSFVGIAIIALPTGIISAGFMQSLSERDARKEEKEIVDAVLKEIEKRERDAADGTEDGTEDGEM